MKKNNKNNIKDLKANKTVTSKSCVWLEDYRDMVSWEMKPLTNNLLSQISADLIQWVRSTNKLTLKSFFIERNINSDLGKAWAQRYPEFKEAWDCAKNVISERREELSMQRSIDGGFAEKMMPYYDSDWKEMAEWRAQLKAKAEAEQNQKATVVVLSEFDYNKNKNEPNV